VETTKYKKGEHADLVLFNPETISDKNTYLESKIFPEGIYGVWVDGDLKYKAL